jgi:hypothetical protein
MTLRLRTALACAAVALSVVPLAACYQMGDVQDIAACQAFAAAQTSYDKTANSALAAPDDQAKQVQWMGAWLLFSPGIEAAAAIPNTASLKTELGAYAKAVKDAGLGASASTQLELWKKGYATRIVKLCTELAAPIEITDLNAK